MGSTVAFPTIVGLPLFAFILLPDTGYLKAKVGVPVFKFTLLPVSANTASPTNLERNYLGPLYLRDQQSAADLQSSARAGLPAFPATQTKYSRPMFRPSGSLFVHGRY